MAPELMEEKSVARPPHGKETDLWAAAVTLYQMSTLKLPFKSQQLSELRQEITSACIDFSPIEDPLLKDLLQKMLQRHPEDRLNIEQVISHPFVTKSDTLPFDYGNSEILTFEDIDDNDMISKVKDNSFNI